jgi:hypothetical protein
MSPAIQITNDHIVNRESRSQLVASFLAWGFPLFPVNLEEKAKNKLRLNQLFFQQGEGLKQLLRISLFFLRQILEQN